MTEAELYRRFAAFVQAPAIIIEGEVVSVDEDNYTVEIKPPGEAEMPDARLKAAIDGEKTGVVEIPEVGSTVLVAKIRNQGDNVTVIKCSKVAETVINGGLLGGLTITPKLVEELGKLSARVDTLYDAINNAVPAPTDGGAALQTTMKATLAAVVETEDFSEIEDESVKH